MGALSIKRGTKMQRKRIRGKESAEADPLC